MVSARPEQSLFEKSLIAHVRCVKPIFHSFRLFYCGKVASTLANKFGRQNVRIIWHAACTLNKQLEAAPHWNPDAS
jgi:hypothetical protein